MFLAYSATLIDPAMVNSLIDTDPQMILPTLVMKHAPLIAQVMFFGALLSAIKSCASATLLAPSVTFSENILKPMLGHRLKDRELLHLMRVVTVFFTLVVTLYAMNSRAGIFKMVENAYQITLVVAFVPLTAGLFWRRASNQGALTAIFSFRDLLPCLASLKACPKNFLAGSLTHLFLRPVSLERAWAPL